MQGGPALDQHELAFLFGDGIVTDPFGDDIHLALFELDGMAIHLDSQPALQDEEELVFMVVTMPGQRSADLGDLDIGVVDLGHHVRTPEFGEGGRDISRGGDERH
jgi:hypothetical protein